MFGNKNSSALAQLESLINIHERKLDTLAGRVSSLDEITEYRWNYTKAELGKLYKSTTPKVVSLSHVDAPNVKVEYPLQDVVQALADHLNLAVLPEQDAEIVVLSADEP